MKPSCDAVCTMTLSAPTDSPRMCTPCMVWVNSPPPSLVSAPSTTVRISWVLTSSTSTPTPLPVSSRTSPSPSQKATPAVPLKPSKPRQSSETLPTSPPGSARLTKLSVPSAFAPPRLVSSPRDMNPAAPAKSSFPNPNSRGNTISTFCN
eukprot:PhF_6_TR28309/c0_g1_i1/m.41927